MCPPSWSIISRKRGHFSIRRIWHCHPGPIKNITPHVKNGLKFNIHFTRKVILVAPHKWHVANGHWPIKAKKHTTYRDANPRSSQTHIHPHDQSPVEKNATFFNTSHLTLSSRPYQKHHTSCQKHPQIQHTFHTKGDLGGSSQMTRGKWDRVGNKEDHNAVTWQDHPPTHPWESNFVQIKRHLLHANA